MILKQILNTIKKHVNRLLISWNHSGIWKIEIRKINTKRIVKQLILKNQLTNTAKDELIKAFQGDYVNLDIKELAIGTGSTTPSATDSKLDSEVYRVTVDENSRIDTGENLTTFTINGAEYSGTFTEIGLFAGWEAAAWSGGVGKDTGLLISKVLTDITLEADEEIYFQRIDYIGG